MSVRIAMLVPVAWGATALGEGPRSTNAEPYRRGYHLRPQSTRADVPARPRDESMVTPKARVSPRPLRTARAPGDFQRAGLAHD